MRKIFLFVLLILSANIFAQDKGFGVGVTIGEPSGFTAKYWVSESNAIDGGIGYSVVKLDNRIFLYADYLWHKNYFTSEGDKIPFHFGLGFSLRSESHLQNYLGLRGVVGISWYFKSVPIDIFLEGAGILNFLPLTSFNPNLDLGCRYYFH
jgi:hypothetical protein